MRTSNFVAFELNEWFVYCIFLFFFYKIKVVEIIGVASTIPAAPTAPAPTPTALYQLVLFYPACLSDAVFFQETFPEID